MEYSFARADVAQFSILNSQFVGAPRRQIAVGRRSIARRRDTLSAARDYPAVQPRKAAKDKRRRDTQAATRTLLSRIRRAWGARAAGIRCTSLVGAISRRI